MYRPAAQPRRSVVKNMDDCECAAELFRNARQNDLEVRQQLTQALADSSPLVRHVAAIELARRWPDEVPEQSIRELLETLARDEYFDPSPIDSDYGTATATDEESGCLSQDIVIAFSHLACGQADFVIPRLLEFWSFDSQFYELGDALLALAFPPSSSRVSAVSLTGVQRRILKALIAQPMIWNNDLTWATTAARYGLPTTLSDIRRFLRYRER